MLEKSTVQMKDIDIPKIEKIIFKKLRDRRTVALQMSQCRVPLHISDVQGDSCQGDVRSSGGVGLTSDD